MSGFAPRAVVVVPTFRRPDMLRATLLSLAAQQTEVPFAILVVENDAEGLAGQDAAFVAAADASAAGSGRTQAPPVLLEKESYIVGVVGGAGSANAAAVDVVVDYEFKGSK